MALDFDAKVALFAKRNNIHVSWQNLKFGFKRAVIYCDTYELFCALYNLCSQKSAWSVSTWTCHENQFDGYIYIMAAEDRHKLDELLEEERLKLEDWWQRYHVADTETRKKMACGAIK